jgi:AbrB family looped-hinge helix DNA binding protein
MESYATAKGQIVIPAVLRRKFGIKEGTRIEIEADDKARSIILRPITRDYVHSLRGKHKGKGLLKMLMADKKIERKL